MSSAAPRARGRYSLLTRRDKVVLTLIVAIPLSFDLTLIWGPAIASVFLPFLPMLPTQILLNNFLYDLAQITIPSDNVDRDYLSRPRRWDIRVIRNFMIFIGPISSVFDFLTFYVLLRVFHASETLA